MPGPESLAVLQGQVQKAGAVFRGTIRGGLDDRCGGGAPEAACLPEDPSHVPRLMSQACRKCCHPPRPPCPGAIY